MWKTFSRHFSGGYRYVCLAIAIVFITISCSNSIKSNQFESPAETSELSIWWEKGFNLEEDEAFRTVVNNWQKQTGYKVKLSFYTTSELSGKAQRAVQASNAPDLMMNQTADRTLYPRLAWQGKLKDVSDVIEPVKNFYPDNILRAVTYYDNFTGKRSYYGVPIAQATIFIFYWQKLLALVDLTANDIPQDWDDFWQFWQQTQLKLKTEQNKNIYGLGFSFSGSSGTDDVYFLFEQILEAHNVSLFNNQGELLIEKPQVRREIIQCLDWYTQFYQQGYIPPDAVKWLNTDNNRNLLNRAVLMTPNTTLSIPAAVRQDTETYYNKLGISEFPNKPNGEPMRYLVSVRQAVIFADSLHASMAKDFLRYLIQPQVTSEYLKASGSRTLPVQKPVWADSFWQQTTDPYIATATKILTGGQTRLFYVVDHPAYSEVLRENIWGKALNRIVIDGISLEQAADEAIERIQQIFAEWQ